MAGVEEIHNYPFDLIIKFKQPGHSFSYKVIKEGVYPNKSSLAYTLPPNKYRISNDYIVETTWGKSKNQCTVQCLINYIDDKPVFQIWFGKYFEYKVFSFKSTTDEYTSQKGTKTSGIYLFGLHLKILDKARDRKRYTHILKPVNQCGNSILTKQATNIRTRMLVEFNKKASKLYNSEDMPVLEKPHLPREGAVSKECQKINKEMARLIPISIIDVNTENQ
ncbi:17064_t:CDS:2, partial [Funneliformis geosporum]